MPRDVTTTHVIDRFNQAFLEHDPGLLVDVVGPGCVIEDAEVEHSILLEGSSVRQLQGRMESSLLGRNVAIGRSKGQPRAFRFMVGDNSEIGIL